MSETLHPRYGGLCVCISGSGSGGGAAYFRKCLLELDLATGQASRGTPAHPLHNFSFKHG